MYWQELRNLEFDNNQPWELEATKQDQMTWLRRTHLRIAQSPNPQSPNSHIPQSQKLGQPVEKPQE